MRVANQARGTTFPYAGNGSSGTPSGCYSAPVEEMTELLERWRGGDKAAAEELMPHLYPELRRLADRQLGRRGSGGFGGPTLRPTELVHEAYLRLRQGGRGPWENRAHFFGVAARAMRHIVVDYARRRAAAKRGGGVADLPLDRAQIAVDEQAETLLALDEALGRLNAFGERLTRVVECRFFAGLTAEETAEALGVTRRTVHRDWLKAQALLRRDLDSAAAPV